MIVVKPRYSKHTYCYCGSDVFGNLLSNVASSTIAQKVVNAATKDGVKGIINKAPSSSIVHKMADSVLKGATSATQKVVENAIVETLMKRPRKEEKTKTAGGNKRIKIDVTDLINGSGIVLD